MEFVITCPTVSCLHPQSTLMAAAGLLSRNPNAPSGLEAGQASSKASSGLEEGRAVVEQEMKAMAIPTAGSREEKAKVGRSHATLVE